MTAAKAATRKHNAAPADVTVEEKELATNEKYVAKWHNDWC